MKPSKEEINKLKNDTLAKATQGAPTVGSAKPPLDPSKSLLDKKDLNQLTINPVSAKSDISKTQIMGLNGAGNVKASSPTATKNKQMLEVMKK